MRVEPVTLQGQCHVLADSYRTRPGCKTPESITMKRSFMRYYRNSSLSLSLNIKNVRQGHNIYRNNQFCQPPPQATPVLPLFVFFEKKLKYQLELTGEEATILRRNFLLIICAIGHPRNYVKQCSVPSLPDLLVSTGSSFQKLAFVLFFCHRNVKNSAS